MDELRMCFEVEVTGFLDRRNVKKEGTDKANLRNLVMPLADAQEPGEQEAVLHTLFKKLTPLECSSQTGGRV